MRVRTPTHPRRRLQNHPADPLSLEEPSANGWTKLNSDAKLITEVSLNNLTAEVGDTTFTDVTGGMMGKLNEAEEAVKAGTEVLFLNATAKDRVKMALKWEKVMGTILTL